MTEEKIIKEIFKKLTKQNCNSVTNVLRTKIQSLMTSPVRSAKTISLFSNDSNMHTISSRQCTTILTTKPNHNRMSQRQSSNKNNLIDFELTNSPKGQASSKITNFKSMNSNSKSHFKSMSSVSFLNSKYSKFDTQEIAYKVSSEYSKAECYDKSFLERMSFYSNKAKKRQNTINELVNQSKPKLPEDQRIEAFNRLISDSNRRAEAKKRISQSKANQLVLSHEMFNSIDNVSPSRSISQKKWDKVYKERFMNKYRDYSKMIKKKLYQKEKEMKNKMLNLDNICFTPEKKKKNKILNTDVKAMKLNSESVSKSSQRTTITNHKYDKSIQVKK